MSWDWQAIGRTADDGWAIYQAVERLRAAVSAQLGEAEAERGATAGGGAGGIPYTGFIVAIINFATSAVQHPNVTALGAGAAAVLLLYGGVAFVREVGK